MTAQIDELRAALLGMLDARGFRQERDAIECAHASWVATAPDEVKAETLRLANSLNPALQLPTYEEAVIAYGRYLVVQAAQNLKGPQA